MDAVVNNPVGRPRSFDEDEVLATVMDVFWRQGYDGTSMADILAATGLHKGSIYQAFGDKHSLYIRALRAYITNMRAEMQRIIAAEKRAVEGLRKVLYHHIEFGAREEGANAGCLALNSLVESGQSDPELMQVLETAYCFRTRLISDTVARAQAQGDLRKDWAADRLAGLVAATEAGILVEVKGVLDEAGAKRLVDDLLAMLS